MSPCAGARLLVDQADAGRRQAAQRSLDIGDAIGDVVQPGPTPVEEFLDGRIRAARLQQLDTRCARADKCDVYLLRLDVLDAGTGRVREEFEYW